MGTLNKETILQASILTVAMASAFYMLLTTLSYTQPSIYAIASLH